MTISVTGISLTLQVVFVSPITVIRSLILPCSSNFGTCVIARSTLIVLLLKPIFFHFKARASPIRSPANIRVIQSGLIKFASSLSNAFKNLSLISGGIALYFSSLFA